jgi:Ca-activated chloride channel homolog
VQESRAIHDRESQGKRYRRTILLALVRMVLLPTLLAALAAAQPTPPLPFIPVPAPTSTELTGAERIVKRVREVNVVFSATNRQGRFVANLSPNDLKVLDDDREPAALVYFLRHQDLPLRIGILVDTSDSVGQQFEFEQQSATLFLQQVLRTGDAAMVMDFNDKPHVAQELTSQQKELEAAIASLHSGGTTALWDAVRFACTRLAAAPNAQIRRRVLVVITDGADNSSSATLDAAIAAALQSETIVLVVNSLPNLIPKNDALLGRLAHETGGALFPGSGLKQLGKSFAGIEQLLRSQYAIGYAPPNITPSAGFHTIRLVARRHGLRLYHRKGYFADE